MTSAPKIVILPGLDGTGRLLTDFAARLNRRHPVEVIVYPTREPLGYDALLDYVKEHLPSENFVLIGESFSGPLAIRIASENLPFLKAVVLGASFARLDLPFKRLLATLAAYLPVAAVPATLLNIMLMNGRATATQRHLLKDTLRGLDQDVIALRVKEALGVDLIHSGTVVRIGS
jgi:pimeloyl-ACP methyl ester carboxylesterase